MPIHVAITRRVRPGCEAEFQVALREFFQTSFAHGGVLGATMIVPPPGSDSREFGILRTFADEKERDDFYASPLYKAWEEKCRPLTETDSWSARPLHGLEAWVRSPQNPPPRGFQRLHGGPSGLAGHADSHARATRLAARQMNWNATINGPICVSTPK